MPLLPSARKDSSAHSTSSGSAPLRDPARVASSPSYPQETNSQTQLLISSLRSCCYYFCCICEGQRCLLCSWGQGAGLQTALPAITHGTPSTVTTRQFSPRPGGPPSPAFSGMVTPKHITFSPDLVKTCSTSFLLLL